MFKNIEDAKEEQRRGSISMSESVTSSKWSKYFSFGHSSHENTDFNSPNSNNSQETHSGGGGAKKIIGSAFKRFSQFKKPTGKKQNRAVSADPPALEDKRQLSA